jgi:hypothetical protein
MNIVGDIISSLFLEARSALWYRITTQSTSMRWRAQLVCTFVHEMILFTHSIVQICTGRCSMTSFHTVHQYMYCAANPTIQYSERDGLALVRAKSSSERAAWKFTAIGRRFGVVGLCDNPCKIKCHSDKISGGLNMA